MKFNAKVSPIEKQQNTCLILPIYEEGELISEVKTLDKKSQGVISKLIKTGLFQPKTGQIFPLFNFIDGLQLLLVGCGKNKPCTSSQFRRTLFLTMKALVSYKIKTAVSYLNFIQIEGQDEAWKTRQTVESTYDGLYRFDLFKTEKEPLPVLEELNIAIDDNKSVKTCTRAIEEGIAISDGVLLTRNLANLPSNICTPSFLAEQAQELAKAYPKLSVNVLEEKDMQKLGMGALLAVAQGSAEDAKLICLEYKGGAKKAPIAFIGKGVTFDTGGNSLKPADSMVGMKYDMCGAATVLGTLKAAAELQLPLNLVGIIGAVENMPGGTAYKPEDIVTSLSGQTIEILNTDAEGRLVLADALTYCERYKPEVVIDIATLTGAVVIALGFQATGLLSNNDDLAKALLKAGIESNDRAWQMPLWEEYQDQLKSPFADMANVGGRPAGTITAACFLSRFAKKFAWAHLDVAGTAAMMAGSVERNATGRPVPLLVQYLLDRVKHAN